MDSAVCAKTRVKDLTLCDVTKLTPDFSLVSNANEQEVVDSDPYLPFTLFPASFSKEKASLFSSKQRPSALTGGRKQRAKCAVFPQDCSTGEHAM